SSNFSFIMLFTAFKRHGFITALIVVISACNVPVKEKKKSTTDASYNFALPKGWTEERIAFPIEFAPQINYIGVENLRFAPGWEFTTSEEHWAYAFLWWLDGKPALDKATLESHLTSYYTGLVGRNIKQRRIPASEVVPVVVTLQKTVTQHGDVESYEGTGVITDYLDPNYEPITLNIKVHKKDCTHTSYIFQISPKPYNHRIWQQLNFLDQEFKCGN
ncbi:MAG: hypothetical protein ABIR81_01850, partial [Ginsengibacter sp.]